jgi:hypothetical protein
MTLRAVDAAGAPVAGGFVYAFVTDSTPHAVAARTGVDGRARLTCDRVKLLLTPWQLGSRQPAGMRNLAMTWVGGGHTFDEAPYVSCRDTSTVMHPGGIMSGRITYVSGEGAERPYADHSQPGGGLFCRAIGVDMDGPQCANWDPLGGRYTFAGLPTGRYLLQGMYGWDEVAIVAGRTTTRDWYECDGCRTGTRPSPAPSPQPSTSPVASPSRPPAP